MQVVGGPCGYHGPYIFYKGLRISKPSFTARQAALRINSDLNAQQNKNIKNINRKSSISDNSGCSASGGLSSTNCSNHSISVSSNNLSDENILISDNNKYDIKNTRSLVIALGDCVPVRPWSDSPIACLAELRMVWKDKNEQCLLAGLRLYFLPENTPMGRNCHGEVSTHILQILHLNLFSFHLLYLSHHHHENLDESYKEINKCIQYI